MNNRAKFERHKAQNGTKKIVVIASLAESLINFRGPLLKTLADQNHHVIACAPEAPPLVKEKLIQMGVDYYNVPLQRASLNPFRDLSVLFCLFRIFRQLRPDIVLGYTIKPVIYGSLAASFAGVKKIYSIITGLGYAFTGTSRKRQLVNLIVRKLYKLSLYRNHKVFFQNPDDCRLFDHLGLIKNIKQAVLINGSGVDINNFQPAFFPQRVSFLLIARLLKDKGIVEYVEAARIIQKRYSNTVFQLVGWLDENPTAITKNELQNWIDEGVINYLGKLDDVRSVLADTTVYVLPSYREGTPRTVLEAMAMGRPIITTDVPGCRETVIDGVNGFLVPPQNISKLASAMEKFILNENLIETMGQQSRHIAVEKYDVRKVNEVILRALGLNDETFV